MAMEGEKKRKREKCEYAKRHYEANKERGMEKKERKVRKVLYGEGGC